MKVTNVEAIHLRLPEVAEIADGTQDVLVVRVHTDDDKSFRGEFQNYLLGEKIKQTNTGGYTPTNNSRTERRLRMLLECFRACLQGTLLYYIICSQKSRCLLLVRMTSET